MGDSGDANTVLGSVGWGADLSDHCWAQQLWTIELVNTWSDKQLVNYCTLHEPSAAAWKFGLRSWALALNECENLPSKNRKWPTEILRKSCKYYRSSEEHYKYVLTWFTIFRKTMTVSYWQQRIGWVFLEEGLGSVGLTKACAIRVISRRTTNDIVGHTVPPCPL